MSKKVAKGTQAVDSQVVVGDGKHKSHINVVLWRKIFILGLSCLIIITVVVGGVLLVRHMGTTSKHNKVLSEQNQATQKKLLVEVANKDNAYATDLPKLKSLTTQLINGANNRTYSVSNQELAMAYNSRAEVELNTADYTNAAKDYEKAAQLNPNLKNDVLYGEFVARYKLGERKTLVPLLQQLVSSLKNNKDDFIQQDVLRYQQYITDLQNGQELDV